MEPEVYDDSYTKHLPYTPTRVQDVKQAIIDRLMGFEFDAVEAKQWAEVLVVLCDVQAKQGFFDS